MCDYSLHHVATRPARVEDKLVTTKFPNSITRGFAAVGEPNIAVCLLPGTEIAFDQTLRDTLNYWRTRMKATPQSSSRPEGTRSPQSSPPRGAQRQ